MAGEKESSNGVRVRCESTTNEEDCLIDQTEEKNGSLHTTKILLATLFILVVGGGLGIVFWLFVAGGAGANVPDVPFQLVNRSTWGAESPKNVTHYSNPPPKLAVIIHTNTLECSNQDMCSSELRNIQRNQMRVFDDIAYNFIIGGDGRTYEGRGWDIQGAFAKQYNNVSLGIAFIGTFENVGPPEKQLQEAKALLSASVERKKLASDYVLVGHREVSDTQSPGTALYNIIKTWPHWKNCYKQSCLPNN